MSSIQAKFTKIFLYVSRACLYLTLVIPLVVWDKFLFPFITPKILIFRLLVLLALFFCAVYLFLSKQKIFPRDKFSLALFTFVAVQFVSSAVGTDFYRSFWSNVERAEGLVLSLFLLILFFVARAVFTTPKDWLRFFSFSLLVSLLVGGIAVLEKFGVKLFYLVPSGRIASSLGNPAYLASYALMHIWLAVLLFLQSKSKVLRIIFALLGVLNFVVMFWTETRGAIVGFFTGISIYLVLSCFVSRTKKIRQISLVILLLVVSFSALVFIARDTNFIQRQDTLRRLSQMSLHNLTIESRLLAWGASWQAFLDHPWLGYGNEHYSVGYNKHFPPEVFHDNGSRVWFDDAHNFFFDILVQNGVIGILSWLILYFFLFQSLFILYKPSQKNKNFFIPIILLFLSHTLTNLFVFDSISTIIIIYYLFALVSFFGAGEKSRFLDRPKSHYVFLIIIALFVFWGFNATFLRPSRANAVAMTSYKKLILEDKIDESFSTIDKAIDMKTYQNAELRQRFIGEINSYLLAKSSLRPEEQKKLWQKAHNLASVNIAEESYNAKLYVQKIDLILNSVLYFPELLPNARGIAQKALQLSPSRFSVYFALGKVEILFGNHDLALEYFKKGESIAPNVVDVRWNLLSAYILTNKPQEVIISEYQDMLDIGLVQNQRNLERIIDIYMFGKRYEESLYWLELARSQNPDKKKYWTTIFEIYKITNNSKLKSFYEEMVKKFPDLESKYQNLL